MAKLAFPLPWQSCYLRAVAKCAVLFTGSIVGCLICSDLPAMSQEGTAVTTLQQLGPALTRCFRPPEHSEGQEITVRFSLNAKGQIIGVPKATYGKLIGSTELRRDFVNAVVASILACTPVHLMPSLGAAVAGRPLSIRYRGGGLETPV